MNGTPVSLQDRVVRRAGYLLGFAMGGFFDGILLHQILQWHHLLSAIQTGPLGSLRMQVTIDGWFHAFMYVVAAVGLWQLFRYRSVTGRPLSLDGIWPAFWIGFGVWHTIDAVFSHWIMGIHRVKMDSSVPLAWDLAWLLVFGVLPLWLGWRKRSGGSGTSGSPGPKTARVLTIVLLGAALVNFFPLRGNNDTTVVALAPQASVTDFFEALDASQASIVWGGGQGDVWVVQGLSLKARVNLYRAGAVYVSGTAAPAGCAAWLQSSRR